MEFEAARGDRTPETLLRMFVAAAALVLVAAVALVFVHFYDPAPSVLALAAVLTAVLAAYAVTSVVAGVWFAWGRYRQHRRAILFVVGITLATLAAHAYIINAPAAGGSGTVSGVPGTPFGDSKVSVTSSLVGRQLEVTVQAEAGGSAIANITLLGNGTPMTGGGFSPAPSYAAPLQPGSTTAGSWTVPAGENLTSLSVDYKPLVCYDAADQVYGCIMDEVYYVPASQHLLAGDQCQVGAPSDTGAYCNPEHPPLGKALMAAGMAVLGEYDAAGWRLMPAVLGSFCVPLLFGTAWEVSGDKKVAYLSAVLLSLDVMFFTQSSAGVLDVPPVFFGLLAFFVYFKGVRWWKADKYVVAGAMMGLAGLAKETAVFAVAALATYVLLFEEGAWLGRAYHSLKVVLAVGAVFAVGMQAFDSSLASAAFPIFVSHVQYIISYGTSLVAHQLACQPTTGYWCLFANDPGGPPILPFDWLLYYSPVAYYLVTVTVNPGNLTYVSVGYYGVTNLLVTWATFVWVPLMAYALYLERRRRRPSPEGSPPEGAPLQEPPGPALSGEGRLAAFTLTLFGWSYIPYLFLFFGGRVTYPFYIIPAIPAMAMGTAYWVSRRWFPKWLAALYVAMVFVFFLVYFPDKAFLPVWLRALIGH
ncbi:MAG: glycosyltransferase family 39 protein [Nitrososphaerota archaeon]|nr:glycosyltransferase family 39 protein [Nitrososphaerota archaeon]